MVRTLLRFVAAYAVVATLDGSAALLSAEHGVEFEQSTWPAWARSTVAARALHRTTSEHLREASPRRDAALR